MDFDHTFWCYLEDKCSDRLNEINGEINEKFYHTILQILLEHLKINDLIKIIMEYLGSNFSYYMNEIMWPLVNLSDRLASRNFHLYDHCVIVCDLNEKFLCNKNLYKYESEQEQATVDMIDRIGVIERYKYRYLDGGRYENIKYRPMTVMIPIVIFYFK